MIPVIDHPNMYEVVNKLQALGSSRQIAQFFKQEHIVGIPCAAYSCPVANYITRETGEIVAVSGYGVSGWDPQTSPRFGDHNPVSEFVGLFDSYAYPNLCG